MTYMYTIYKTRQRQSNTSPSLFLSPLSLSKAPSDHQHTVSGLWGRLSCAILVADWDSALEELNSLRKHIDESVGYVHCNIL